MWAVGGEQRGEPRRAVGFRVDKAAANLYLVVFRKAG